MELTLYTAYSKALMDQNLLNQLLAQLPASLHSRAHRYKSDLSAYNYVVGRLLLKRGLESFGYEADLEKIELEENGKPYLPGIAFNISHSDHQVICAFANEGAIGIDLEKVKPIDFSDFTSMFTHREWQMIKSAEDAMHTFYWFWTRKESIIKAMGLNLSYLHQIELDVSKDHFEVDGEQWFLKELEIGEGYIGSICSRNPSVKIKYVEVQLAD